MAVYISVLQSFKRMLKILGKFQALCLALVVEHSRRKAREAIDDDPWHVRFEARAVCIINIDGSLFLAWQIKHKTNSIFVLACVHVDIERKLSGTPVRSIPTLRTSHCTKFSQALQISILFTKRRVRESTTMSDLGWSLVSVSSRVPIYVVYI